jgi:nitroreductase
MQIDEFLDLARKRRSIRKFKPDPVPDEYIEKILEAGRWAMSGANAQPWEFIVIKDQETKNKLAEIKKRDWEMTYITELTRLPEYRKPRALGKSSPDMLFNTAPVIIATVGDMRTMQASTLPGRFFEVHIYDHNMANVTQMIHLAAAALGLSAQWVSIDLATEEEIKPILGIPHVLRLFTLIPIGYAAYQPTPYRRELSELVHHEKYDMSKFRSQSDIQEFIKYLRQRSVLSGAYPVKK